MQLATGYQHTQRCPTRHQVPSLHTTLCYSYDVDVELVLICKINDNRDETRENCVEWRWSRWWFCSHPRWPPHHLNSLPSAHAPHFSEITFSDVPASWCKIWHWNIWNTCKRRSSSFPVSGHGVPQICFKSSNCDTTCATSNVFFFTPCVFGLWGFRAMGGSLKILINNIYNKIWTFINWFFAILIWCVKYYGTFDMDILVCYTRRSITVWDLGPTSLPVGGDVLALPSRCHWEQ